MKERLQLVSLQQTGRYRVTELAEQFGVSRKTAYKWLARFCKGGMDGLAQRSRAPHRHPNATPLAVVEAVLRAKARRPQYGPAKLQAGPDEPTAVAKAWPAPSTIGTILKRHGLVSARRRRRRVPPWTQPFHRCTGPNSVWSTDFKGWFRTGDGRRCDPLTISDAFSRMLLCCEVVARPDYSHVRRAMERTFQEYGLPEVLRSDNGAPFASLGAGGLSPLAVWWVKLGILPERIQPGHPEQNGRHERLHGTLKQATAQPPALTLAAQQGRFDAFRTEYNQERPHQALGQVPPATLYVPSPRPYPAHIEDPRYPEWALARRVRSNGEVKWRGKLIFISQTLVGELVGITELDHAWLVAFGPITLGLLRPGQERLERLPACTPTGPWVAHFLEKSVTHVPG